MAELITADMIIHDIVTKHPAMVKVFHGHGLPCTACAVGSRESVAGGARTHCLFPQKIGIFLPDFKTGGKGETTPGGPQKTPGGGGGASSKSLGPPPPTNKKR